MPVMNPEDLLIAQQLVHDQIADGLPLETVVTSVCQLAEQALPDSIVSVMLYDPVSTTLNLVQTGQFSARYWQAAQGLPVGPGIATCGVAAHTGQLEVTPDIHQSADWAPYRELADAEGFRACWSTPVFGRQEELLGTFGVYRRQPGTPSAVEQRLLQGLNRLLAVAIRRHHEQQALQLGRERFRSLFSRHPDAVLEFDLQGRFQAGNRSFERTSGSREEHWFGRHFRDFLSGDGCDAADHGFRRAIQGEASNCGVVAFDLGARRYSMEITWLPIELMQRTVGVYLICKDVSRQVDSENRLMHDSKHDRLTGLLNLAEFQSRVPELCKVAAQRGRLVALLYLDVDGFSPVNDALGREIGDVLLVGVGQRLEQLMPEGGMLARVEADEFMLALPDCPYEQRVDEFAERVLVAMTEHFEVDGHHLHISVSLGVTTCQGLEDGGPNAIQRANLAMRRAKESGRNNWQWYGEGMQGSREYLDLRRDIQHAMESDAFRLHYQPLVNARSGEIRTVEALIRWFGPDGGMISPGRFIPVAESTGQIIPIGRWVLFRACHDIARFNARTQQSLAVAVNISPLQFRRASFVDDVTRALEESGLPPRLLELEVTEGVLMRSTDEVMRTLRRIRELGVRVVIDDFGTGFSSLSYLRDLPINRLKIDRSFIADMLTSSGSSAIVEGVITMAHRLGLLVVAEGVETGEQRQELVRQNCDLLQGYFFSPALPLKELEDYWRSQA